MSVKIFFREQTKSICCRNEWKIYQKITNGYVGECVIIDVDFNAANRELQSNQCLAV